MSQDIIAEVPYEVVMGATISHGDIVLEIEDISPQTFKGRKRLALDIIDYNRKCRAQAKETNTEFGDSNTPYHFWDINWWKVVKG